jgi:hypothetical protein
MQLMESNRHRDSSLVLLARNDISGRFIITQVFDYIFIHTMKGTNTMGLETVPYHTGYVGAHGRRCRVIFPARAPIRMVRDWFPI